MRALLLYLISFIFISSSVFGQRSQRLLLEELDERIVRNEVFNEGFTGFHLIDADNGTILYDFRGNKFFTPASNVKLFTYYLAEKLLADSVTTLYYRYQNDTLEIKGCGWPLLFHPDLGELDQSADFLRQSSRPIRYYPDELPRYGDGWSWDDFNYGYVYERSLLPVYGNRLTIRSIDGYADPVIIPSALAERITVVEGGKTPTLTKVEESNDFRAALRLYFYKNINVQRPLNMSAALTADLLSTALNTPVILGEDADETAGWLPLRQVFPDTLLAIMLRQSDNFLAEQLLLLCANEFNGSGDLTPLLAFSRDSLIPELELIPRQWVDGSGLSRYNQFSPRQMTLLLRRAYLSFGPARLKKLFATGGENGTISRYFGQYKTPYVWAKSGSLRNVLCLSGMLETDDGRKLLFSFMHNNFPGRSKTHYAEMESILNFVRNNF